jgi:hypothetical protein
MCVHAWVSEPSVQVLVSKTTSNAKKRSSWDDSWGWVRRRARVAQSTVLPNRGKNLLGGHRKSRELLWPMLKQLAWTVNSAKVKWA